MATIYFPSLDQCEVVEIELLQPKGTVVSLRLLVDSGFTGLSCFLLPLDAEQFAQADATPSQTAGALTGTQRRVLVTCRIAALAFERSVMAILADVASLELPPGVQGLAGLQFLRHFHHWGAVQRAEVGWSFFLSDDVGDPLREPN